MLFHEFVLSYLSVCLLCVTVLVVSGEGYGFLQFAQLYPHVLVQLFVFSLCSSVGQV